MTHATNGGGGETPRNATGARKTSSNAQPQLQPQKKQQQDNIDSAPGGNALRNAGSVALTSYHVVVVERDDDDDVFDIG